MNHVRRGIGLTGFLLTLACSAGILAQRVKLPQDAPGTFAPNFDAYKACKFSDGLAVVDVSPLADGVKARAVDTSKGKRQIDLAGGNRIMFGYPGSDFYANLKVEKLPTASYSQSKQNLIDNFDFILASGKNTRNYRLKPHMNDFDIRGLDRDGLEGGVLGIYLLFDDVAHDVITIYFLNQKPEVRKFKTIEEYQRLRDQFLPVYTSCVRTNEAQRSK